MIEEKFTIYLEIQTRVHKLDLDNNKMHIVIQFFDAKFSGQLVETEGTRFFEL